jgi:hypothetical protein
VLGDRRTYADVAADRGRAGDAGRRYYAARFRDALEALAEAWAAKGPDRQCSVSAGWCVQATKLRIERGCSFPNTRRRGDTWPRKQNRL